MPTTVNCADLPDLRIKLVRRAGHAGHYRPLFFAFSETADPAILVVLGATGVVGQIAVDDAVFFDAPQLKANEDVDVVDGTGKKVWSGSIASFDPNGSTATLRRDDTVGGLRLFETVDLLLVRKKGS